MPKSYLQSEQVKWYPYLRDIHIQSSTSTAPVHVLSIRINTAAVILLPGNIRNMAGMASWWHGMAAAAWQT